jgi:hypothetical protein
MKTKEELIKALDGMNEPARTKIGMRFDLIPGDVLAEVAKVFAHGAAKYGDNNWRQGRLKGDKCPLNHALKHLAYYQAGIPDDESADPKIHLSHAIVNLMFELHYELVASGSKTDENN